MQLIDASRKKYDVSCDARRETDTFGYVGGNPLAYVDFNGVVSRPLDMTGGSHTVTVVESGGVTTTLASHNIDGVNLLQVNHPSDVNLP